jgi:hypothetical protein
VNLDFAILLYIAVAVTLGYLIYRYARYSRWEETDAGRAFMGMKVCLLSLVFFGLWAKAFPASDLRDEVRTVIVGGILAALIYQVKVMVRRQGGFRRNRRVERWVPYTDDPNRRDKNPCR